MRVSIDTNVFISYLLNNEADRAPTRLIRAALNRDFDLHLSENQIIELVATAQAKPYLQSRINVDMLVKLVQRIRDAATIILEITHELPSFTRDPGDDYLITHGLLERIDYLVTGDKDLLVLGRINDLLIVTPAEFMLLMEPNEE